MFIYNTVLVLSFTNFLYIKTEQKNKKVAPETWVRFAFNSSWVSNNLQQVILKKITRN